METTIVTKEAFKVIGLELCSSLKDGRLKVEGPPFFHKFVEEATLNDIPNRINQNQLCIFKFDFENDPRDLSYIIGAEVESDQELPEEMISLDMLASQYAKVTITKRGFDDVYKGFMYLENEWLPQSDYVKVLAPPFIYYDDRFFSIFNEQGYAGNPLADLYLPVQPK